MTTLLPLVFTASPAELERLRQFFGAYFHQDWDADAPNADGIIDRFLSDHPNGQELASLAALIDACAETQRGEAELEQALSTELWCSFVPSSAGLRASEWLRHVSTRLRAAVKTWPIRGT
jgi:hypothetical protein